MFLVFPYTCQYFFLNLFFIIAIILDIKLYVISLIMTLSVFLYAYLTFACLKKYSFLNGLFVFLLLNYKSSLYIFKGESHIRYMICKYFLLFCELSLYFPGDIL